MDFDNLLGRMPLIGKLKLMVVFIHPNPPPLYIYQIQSTPIHWIVSINNKNGFFGINLMNSLIRLVFFSNLNIYFINLQDLFIISIGFFIKSSRFFIN